jgi:hypothetical protein
MTEFARRSDLGRVGPDCFANTGIFFYVRVSSSVTRSTSASLCRCDCNTMNFPLSVSVGFSKASSNYGSSLSAESALSFQFCEFHDTAPANSLSVGRTITRVALSNNTWRSDAETAGLIYKVFHPDMSISISAE